MSYNFNTGNLVGSSYVRGRNDQQIITENDPSGLYMPNGMNLPEAGKLLYTNGDDLLYYVNKELTERYTDGNAKSYIAYAKENAEVGVFTGTYYSERGRIKSVQVKKSVQGGTITAWVAANVRYETEQTGIPGITPGMQTGNGTGTPTTGTGTDPKTQGDQDLQTVNSITDMAKRFALPAIILFLITRKRKK